MWNLYSAPIKTVTGRRRRFFNGPVINPTDVRFFLFVFLFISVLIEVLGPTMSHKVYDYSQGPKVIDH